MRLRYSGWVALFGIFLIGPATASPTGAPAPGPEAAAASPATPSDQATASPVQTTEITPSETKPSPDAGQPQGATEPAALQLPEAEAVEPPPPPPPVITLKVNIDLAAQRMSVMEGGEVIHRWPISSGTRRYATPNGTYKPQWRSRMWRSKQYYGAPMPYSVFFHRGYAVHGTYATGMLGRPASHGCIRLATKNAATFFKLVGKHGMESTEIVVHGKASTPKVAKRSRSRTRQAKRRRPVRGYANSSPPWVTW